MSEENPRWIVVARLLRPRGNKGELAAEILTDFPERLTTMPQVYLGRVNGEAISGALGSPEPHAVAVKTCWISQNHRGQCVFHFAGVLSINEAEKFRGLHVFIPFEQRVTLPEGHCFVSELIGCGVFERIAAANSLPSSAYGYRALGTVRDVEFPGEGERIRGTPLLEVETEQGELLIPLAADICTRIDTVARRIEVSLPEGLRELNS